MTQGPLEVMVAEDARSAVASAFERQRGSGRPALDALTARMLVAELLAEGIRLVRHGEDHAT